jgi:hypothetical protein
MRRQLWALAFALTVWAGASSATEDACLGLTVPEAAALLGVPADGLKAQRKQLHRGLWQCSFSGSDPARMLAYSVERGPDEKTAKRDLQRYREGLETAAETAPFRGKLPKGAYSEVSDIGDENVWTDINSTFTFRRQALTVQVQSPADKLAKIKAGQRLASKLP